MNCPERQQERYGKDGLSRAGESEHNEFSPDSSGGVW
jgi:hypothetical protein